MTGDLIMAHTVNYVKPNMTNLRGKIGRSIIETIMNTPKPDLSELEKEVEAFEQMVLAEDKNEHD